jgi:hypothetical protein
LPSAIKSFERCPNAIPVARSSVMVKRLPHAALCRSPRPVVFGDFFLYFIKSHPFFLMGGTIELLPTEPVAREQPIEFL